MSNRRSHCSHSNFIIAFAILATVASSTVANATCPTFHTLTNGTAADASQVMDNYNYILQCPNFSGTVGIGISAPATSKLYVNGDSTSADGAVSINRSDLGGSTSHLLYGSTGDWFIRSSLSSGKVNIQDVAGYVGIGTATGMPGASKLYVNGDSTSTNGALIVNRSDLGGSMSHLLYGSTGDWYIRSSLTSGKIVIQDVGGNVGIGTGSPGQKLDVAGTIRQTNCTTARTLSTNTSGDIICTSDARLKNILGTYDDGLKAITRITPQRFTYKPTATNPVETFVHAGFIAQDVLRAIPQAVAVQYSGYLSLDTTAILAASVNAIKELKAENDLQAAEIARLRTQDTTVQSQLKRQAAEIQDVRGRLAAVERRMVVHTAENLAVTRH